MKDVATKEQQHIAIDGKRHRGLKTEEEQLHLVGAYAVENGLLISQERVADKSNEITAIPKILDNLEIKGQIVSI